MGSVSGVMEIIGCMIRCALMANFFLLIHCSRLYPSPLILGFYFRNYVQRAVAREPIQRCLS